MIRRIAFGFGAVLMVFIATYTGGWLRERRAKKDWEARRLADSVAVQTKKDSLSLVYRDSVVVLHEKGTTRIIERVLVPGRTDPVPVDSVKAIANACTEERSACQAQRAAAQNLINDLRAAVKVRDDMLAVPEPRFSATIDALYDPFQKSPAFAGTVAARIVDPVSIVGTASLRKALVWNEKLQRADSTLSPRLEVGLRYTIKW